MYLIRLEDVLHVIAVMTTLLGLKCSIHLYLVIDSKKHYHSLLSSVIHGPRSHISSHVRVIATVQYNTLIQVPFSCCTDGCLGIHVSADSC